MNPEPMARALPVEICLGADSPLRLAREVRLCARAGVSRVELCGRMDLAGLTPSPHSLQVARRAWGPGPGLLAMLRPRGGDFEYSSGELRAVERALVACARAGADGVVCGVLRRGRLHLPALRRLCAQARGLGLELSLHRAFDALANPSEALEELAELGVRRVLSSGGVWGDGTPATANLAALKALHERAGRLELVLAGGLDAAAVPELRAALSRGPGRLSLHAWSGVRRAGRLDPRRLRELLAAARR